MSKREYTVEIGWDAHTSAGFDPEVYATPEAAVAARGIRFHPDFDTVVSRKVGTSVWKYRRKDQKFDREAKLREYREARNG